MGHVWATILLAACAGAPAPGAPGAAPPPPTEPAVAPAVAPPPAAAAGAEAKRTEATKTEVGAAKVGATEARAAAGGAIRGVEIHRRAGVVTVHLRGGAVAHARAMPQATRFSLTVQVFAGGGAAAGGAAGGGAAEPPGVAEAAAAAWAVPPGARYRAMLSPEGLSLRGSGAPGDLEDALRHAAAMIDSPRLDPAKFEAWRGQARDRVERRRTTPQRAVSEIMVRLLGDGEAGGPGRRRALEAGEIDALELPVVQAWLTERLAGSPVELAVVADLPLETLVERIGSAFRLAGERPSPEARAAGEAQGLLAAAAPKVHLGADAEARREAHAAPACHEVTASIPPSEGYALASIPGPAFGDLRGVRVGTVAAMVLQGQLAVALREAGITAQPVSVVCVPGRGWARRGREGGAGGAGGAGGMLLASVRVQGDARSAREAQRVLERVLAAAAAELPAAEVKAATDAMRTEAEARLKEPDYWSSVLSFSRHHRLDIEELADAPRAYREIRAAEIAQALQAWLREGPGARLVVLPEPAGAPAPAEPPVDPAKTGAEGGE